MNFITRNCVYEKRGANENKQKDWVEHKTQ